MARWIGLPEAATAASAGTGDGRAEGQDAVDRRCRTGGRPSIVACIAAGSEILPVRTLPVLGSATAEAREEAVAAQGQGLVADFLVEADGVLDAGRLEPLTGAEAGLELGLADVGLDAEVRKTSEPEFIETTGMPASIAFLIAGLRASGFGIETTRPLGFLATAASMSCDMLGMSLSASGAL